MSFMLIEKNEGDKNAYYTYKTSDDIYFNVYVEESYDAGMINTVIPFYQHYKIRDDLVDVIKKRETHKSFGEYFCLDSKNLGQCTDLVFSTMNEINNILSEFNIETSEYSASIEVPLLINEKYKSVYFSRANKHYIESVLLQTLNDN